MTGRAELSGGDDLALWAREARVRSQVCTSYAVRAAGSAGLISDRVEHMIDRLAKCNPQYAGRLRAISSTAVASRAAIAADRQDRRAADRPNGQPAPERWYEPDAWIVSGLEAYLRDMAIVQERDRMAGELRDKVIQRVFAAGLTLQGAAGLTTQPEVRRRIDAAAAELDEVIRVIRDALFGPRISPANHEPG
jgi:signal transduction histidine kinase